MSGMRIWALLCVAALSVLVVGPAQGTPGQVASLGLVPRDLLGDMDCDGTVDFDDIDGFTLALSGPAAYYAEYPTCVWLNADCNGDGLVDFDDVGAFVDFLASGGPYFGGSWHGPCQNAGDGWCPEDVIEHTVLGHDLYVRHENAEYNCCPDDIVIAFSMQGQVLRFDEEEFASFPCPCMCCYETGATVYGLPSGTYTARFYWMDPDYGYRVDTQQVIIP